METKEAEGCPLEATIWINDREEENEASESRREGGGHSPTQDTG